MVLKATPHCSRGAHHRGKWGEAAALRGGFRLNLHPSAFLRFWGDPETRPGPGRMGVALPGVGIVSATDTVAAGCATHSAELSLQGVMDVHTSIFLLYVNPRTIIQNYL